MQDVPSALVGPANQRVLACLREQSAHGDLAEVLQAAVAPLGDVQTFCPDPAAFRYVLVSTRGIVFGFAAGMHTIAFRLDARMRERALATGGVACPKYGAEWVAVHHQRPDDDWPRVDLAFWARKAYVYSRSLAP
jgi:hypothetical protein